MTERDLIDGVIDREGDTFTNFPNDKGGATKYGVTRRGRSLQLGRPVSVLEIERLTYDEAVGFYEWYFAATRLTEIASEPLRVFALDFAVLSGRERAVRGLQRLVGVAADGICGPLTLAAVNAAAPRPLFKRYIHDRMDHLIATAIGDVPEEVFHGTNLEWLHGWWNRVFDIGVSVL